MKDENLKTTTYLRKPKTDPVIPNQIYQINYPDSAIESSIQQFRASNRHKRKKSGTAAGIRMHTIMPITIRAGF